MSHLLQYLKPYRTKIAIVAVLVFLHAFADLSLPGFLAQIIDTGIARGDIHFILRTGGTMILVALAGAAATIASAYISSRVSYGFARDLREAVFTHVETFSPAEFGKLGTSSLITRTTNDITQVQSVVLMMMRMFLMAPMMLVGSVVMAVSREPRLSSALFAILPVLVLVAAWAIRKSLPLFKLVQEKIDKLNLILREHLSGVRVIRAFNRTEDELARFDQANRDLTQTASRVNKLMAMLMPLVSLSINLATIAIVWIGSRFIAAGSLGVGNLIAFIQYGMHVLISLVLVSSMFVMLPRAQASAERIGEVLKTQPSIKSPACPAEPGPQEGRIEFRHVTFAYPGAERPALEDISFIANPGEVVAIIGGTGSGKSTLVNLIMRFFDPNTGEILFDGVDIRNLDLAELRRRIGYVPQKPVIFSGSVESNLKYGDETATLDQLWHALEVAQARDFIESTEGKLQAHIAQGGTNLSGGQKQRLSIARALVRQAPVYIFDDSFSALDFRTDARLREALKKETVNKTVFIVAQRIGTVMDADKIIVLDDGKLVGIGTHRELLKTCSVYREIALSQLSEEEIA